MKKLPIGIDLGTTYSSIAVCKNGETEVIPNDQGNRTTPSCVTFTKSRKFIGDGAVRQSAENAENSIYAVKRIIGRSYNNSIVQEEMKSWPFKVVNDNNDIKIEVMFEEKRQRFSPEDISAMILVNLKAAAEEYLQTKIKDVVITCPANFNDSQRQAKMKAAEIAGLNVIRMINEPTAAALAYGLKVGNTTRKNILVFEFGGGTCDISILTVKNHNFTIRATKGDTHLGGEDCDKRLVNYFVEKLKKEQDISENKNLLRQLKIECENTKKVLSVAQNRDFVFDILDGFHGTITRTCFEDLCYDIFERAIDLVKSTLKDANMDASEINEVLLVGGSSRIPKVQEMISEFFGRKISSSKEINPEEAVVIGAAIQAASLQNELPENMKGLKLCDVCPLSLGTDVFNQSFSVLIKRNTPIPVSVTKTFLTCRDNQTEMDFKIYEGERVMAFDNRLLGSFTISGIPPKPHSEAKAKLTIEIDDNGIMTVSAVEQESENKGTLVVTRDRRSNKNEAEIVITDAEKFKVEDKMQQRRLQAFKSLQCFLLDVDAQIKSFPVGKKRENAERYVRECFTWLYINTLESKETFQLKEEEIQRKWVEIVSLSDDH